MFPSQMLMQVTSQFGLKAIVNGFSENIYTHPSPESNTPKYLHLQFLLLTQ